MMSQHEQAAADERAWEGSVRYDQAPNTYIARGDWPTADLVPDAPPGAHYAQEIARRLQAARGERGLSQQALADMAGLGQRTISRVLYGDVYCDVATLARLETALQISLYPGDWFTQEL
ncbi:helix-turn-helix domain-containing protein [Nonomuraea sp. NPDC003707]